MPPSQDSVGAAGVTPGEKTPGLRTEGLRAGGHNPSQVLVMGLTSALATSKGSERCRFAGQGARAAEHLLEMLSIFPPALQGEPCPLCPPGLGIGGHPWSSPSLLSLRLCPAAGSYSHCSTTERWSRLESRKVVFPDKLLFPGAAVAAPCSGAVTCEMKVRPEKAQEH